MGAGGDAGSAKQIGFPSEYVDARRLGSGTEGGTWLATDRGTGRPVVLKRVPPERLHIVRRAFELLRSVSSPHLPAPRALAPGPGEDGGVWLVTDYVEGASVAAVATRPRTALREALGVAHALAAIHRAQTHHGDVSAANVIVTGTGGVIVVDLGQLGQCGTGTPGFIAPEVLGGGGGPAADWFGLGSLLCLRLYGSVPWQRPEVLLNVRSVQDVRARITGLAGATPPSPPLRALLERLLHPDASERVWSADLVVSQLEGLVRAAEAGVDLPARTTWWIPQRWPYRHTPDGVDVDALARVCRASRLVVVVGPTGVGRGRVVEELVQQLQVAGHDAVACEPGAAGACAGQPNATWMEAWLSLAPQAVLGLVSEPPWPSLGPDASDEAAERAARAHAALVLEAAGSARATLVVPVGPQLAGALERHDSRAEGAVCVVRVRPWDRPTLRRALREVVHSEDPAGEDQSAWVDVLMAATGGWPGRVVSAVVACAAAGVEHATPAAVASALAAMPEAADLGLDAALARDVLRAWWTADVTALAGLPAHMHDNVAPRSGVVAQARRQLGRALTSWAQHVHAQWPGDSGPIPLALAVDADCGPDVEAALLREHALWLSGGGAGPVLQWLSRCVEGGGHPAVGDQAMAVACRGLLADGDAERALTLASLHPHGPACQLEAARAAQRLGLLDDAQRYLVPVTRCDSEDARAGARGLAWRVLVDRGQAGAAAADARARVDALPTLGLGAAAARLWGAMALMAVGDTAAADVWLDAAQAAVGPLVAESGGPRGTEPRAPGPRPGSTAAAAAGVLARVAQLRGNAAHTLGQLGVAQQHYAVAATAFVHAGEAVGALLVRGNLAGLAISTFRTTAGIQNGRRALRGLVSRGQLSATLEAALNLVQLLTRVGADDQARAVASLAEALFAGRREDDPLVRGRLARIAAELAVGRDPPRVVADAMAAAAVDLQAGDAGREAVEAWVGAAAAARRHGDVLAACAHLDCARAIGAQDEDSRVLEATAAVDLAVAQAAGASGDAAIGRALAGVVALGSPRRFANLGRLDLAWGLARCRALAMQHLQGLPRPARRDAALELGFVVDLIMKNTDPHDRGAVRASLTRDATERSALRALLGELEEASSPPAAKPVAPAMPSRIAARDTAGARLQGLLRVYRRLAREDRLEHLLEQVVDAMMELTDAERGAVVVVPLAADESGAGQARIEVTRELAAGGEGARFSRSIIERVLTDGEPMLSVDAAQDDRFDASRSVSHLNLRSVLAVPLRFRGELFGAAYVDHRLRRGAFDEGDLSRMEEFADLAALAVAHARALAALRTQAQQLEAQRERLSGLLEAREVEVEGLRGRVHSDEPSAGSLRHGMVGNSVAMKKVFRLIDRLADSDVPVVIHGESGTGKELAARAIHAGGGRRGQPFVAENCGAIPEALIESVLFGHARGAFTGAAKSRAGLFEAASGGTIFLDEIGEMSPAMQTKLLRVLQEGEVRRIGETHPRPVDVRVIAASNQDLDAMVTAGSFRRDLYYRIHVVKLVLPPLREREGDLPTLVEHFAARHGRPQLHVSAAAMRVLCVQAWPGNVRELDNEVQRWIALSEGEIEIDDLSVGLLAGPQDSPTPRDLRIRPQVDRLERDLIEQALEQTAGNQTKAAVLLGLSRFGLQKKLRRMADAAESTP